MPRNCTFCVTSPNGLPPFRPFSRPISSWITFRRTSFPEHNHDGDDEDDDDDGSHRREPAYLPTQIALPSALALPSKEKRKCLLEALSRCTLCSQCCLLPARRVESGVPKHVSSYDPKVPPRKPAGANVCQNKFVTCVGVPPAGAARRTMRQQMNYGTRRE